MARESQEQGLLWAGEGTDVQGCLGEGQVPRTTRERGRAPGRWTDAREMDGRPGEGTGARERDGRGDGCPGEGTGEGMGSRERGRAHRRGDRCPGQG